MRRASLLIVMVSPFTFAADDDVIDRRICIPVSQFAYTVMEARQSGASRADMAAVVRGRLVEDTARLIIDDAFLYPVYPEDYQRILMSANFLERWALRCARYFNIVEAEGRQ